MSSTPSGRRRGHSSRKSQSSTPISQAQATPRGTRANGSAVASSSPLFFQTSSPAKSTPQQPSQRSIHGLIPSSPRHASQRSRDGLLPSSPRQASSVADREATPKASRQPLQGHSPCAFNWKNKANKFQNHPLSDMKKAHLLSATHNRIAMASLRAAVACSSDRTVFQSMLGEATSIPIYLAQHQEHEDESSWAKTACL